MKELRIGKQSLARRNLIFQMKRPDTWKPYQYPKKRPQTWAQLFKSNKA